MPDPLQLTLAGRTQFSGNPPPQGGFFPESYDPSLDLENLTSFGASPFAQRMSGNQQALKGIAQRQHSIADYNAAMPELMALDPENPVFSQQLNSLISKNPTAIQDPGINQMMRFKEGLAHHPEFTAEDITDPELLDSFKQREGSMDWRQNRQQYLFDQQNKQRRLDLIQSGMHPDDVASITDQSGRIPDDVYFHHKAMLGTNQKQPLPSAEMKELIKLHQEAQNEPTPEDKLNWLKTRYPSVTQDKLTPEMWGEAYRGLTPKKEEMRLMLQGLTQEGKAVPRELLQQYGINPVTTKWDPKSKRLIQGPDDFPTPATTKDKSPIKVNSKSEYDAIPTGTQFEWNGKVAIKKG